MAEIKVAVVTVEAVDVEDKGKGEAAGDKTAAVDVDVDVDVDSLGAGEGFRRHHAKVGPRTDNQILQMSRSSLSIFALSTTPPPTPFLS